MTALLYSLDYHHWFMLGLLCLVLDGLTRNSLPMWLGLTALTVGLAQLLLPLAGLHTGWPAQLWMVAALLPCFLFGWWWRDLRAPRHLPAELVGRRARLDKPLRRGRGKLWLDGRRWPVTGADLPAGTEVEIQARQGLAFRVEAVENTRP